MSLNYSKRRRDFYMELYMIFLLVVYTTLAAIVTWLYITTYNVDAFATIALNIYNALLGILWWTWLEARGDC
ncbi:MAG: hypothetical protein MRT15_04120 [archaeon YNP-LCB-003-016]|uniref:hypothetical protein n=1 Tax=Candidatus Culexarchaeum yellowstonense TaxID=2928963 RepID=UPI0026EEC734|nr:hypothetical protein [Candidatus Culexarchaeum yellowstonense]MCR6691554.1 hypothetical protein [Candidatus Culexarchaeum yellowstonense]